MSEQKSNNSVERLSEPASSENLLVANNSETVSIETNDLETGHLVTNDKQGRSLPASSSPTEALKKEINGPKGLEPTRYGDWESKGRCYDF